MYNVTTRNIELNSLILIIQTGRELEKLADAYLYRKLGMSLIKLVALEAIELNHGVATATRIAELTQTERHNISTLIVRMYKDRLIDYKYDTRDRRKLNIKMTAKGRSIKTDCEYLLQALIKELMKFDTTKASADVVPLSTIRDRAHNSLIEYSKQKRG